MGMSTGLLHQHSLRKSEREKAQDDDFNPLSVVNVDLRAFEKRDQPTDDTAKTHNESVRRWVNANEHKFGVTSTLRGPDNGHVKKKKKEKTARNQVSCMVEC